MPDFSLMAAFPGKSAQISNKNGVSFVLLVFVLKCPGKSENMVFVFFGALC